MSHGLYDFSWASIWAPFCFGNHKTRGALSLHVNIVTCVQGRQRQTMRFVTLSEHYLTYFVWINYLRDGIKCCHIYCFISHECYIIDVQLPTILIWKSCVILTEEWIGYLWKLSGQEKSHILSLKYWRALCKKSNLTCFCLQ